LSKNYFMKTKILSLLVFVSTSIYSQTTEPIETDRPDQTETPAIVPKGMFQVESGFTFQKNDVHNSSFSLPSTLWKYGVNDNFELRLITEFLLEEINNKKFNGLTPIFIGFKVKLAEEKGIVPKTSFIAHIGLPNAASTYYKIDYFAPEFRFTMQHTLSDKLNLGYNLGAEWDGFSAEPTFVYTLTTGYSITEKLGSYIELYGFLPQNNKAIHNLDGGITYLINNNFMLDLSSSIGITNNAPKHYFAFGFSFRI
jgi:Putative MetA-pathway of phenol degradation